VETLAVGSVLAVFNWPRNSERYRRVERFVNEFFSRFGEFQKPGRHPKWKEVSLSATVPGWERAEPARGWLEHQTEANASADPPRTFEAFMEGRGVAVTPAQRDLLYRDFLAWQRERERNSRAAR
jgi:hypothetical protein